jgi:hypothetical protein
VSPYYCIVNLPGAPAREIAVLAVKDEMSAGEDLVRFAERWPGYETIALYSGERSIAVLANPALGFPADPLPGLSEAA